MFKEVKFIIPKSLSRAGITKQVQSKGILKLIEAEINKIIGKDLGGKLKPLQIKNKNMAIACLSDKAAQKLKVSEKDLINNINKIAEKEIVTKIKYLV